MNHWIWLWYVVIMILGLTIKQWAGTQDERFLGEPGEPSKNSGHLWFECQIIWVLLLKWHLWLPMVTLKISIHSPLYIPINQEFTNPVGKSHLRFWCFGEHVWSNAKGSWNEMSVLMPHSGWSRSSLFDDVWWTRSNPNLIPIYHNLSRLIGLL